MKNIYKHYCNIALLRGICQNRNEREKKRTKEKITEERERKIYYFTGSTVRPRPAHACS